MIIGGFEYDSGTDTYKGGIQGIGADTSFAYLRPELVPSGNAPDYRLEIERYANCPFQIGVAWKCGTIECEPVLGVCIDMPALPQRIYAAVLSKREYKGWFDLIWTRPTPLARSLAEETALALGMAYLNDTFVPHRSRLTQGD